MQDRLRAFVRRILRPPPGVRHGLHRLVQFAVAGLVTLLACALLQREAGLVGPLLWALGGAFGCLVAVELHARLRTLVEPHSAREGRRRLLAGHGRRLASVYSDQAALRTLAESLCRGLEPRSLRVFLYQSGSWQPVIAVGETSSLKVELAIAAAALLGDEPYFQVELREKGERLDVETLRRAEVELVLALQFEDSFLGVALVGLRPDGARYTAEEIRDFARPVAFQTSIVLHHFRRGQERLVENRLATAERVAVGVAHDLGNPLRVIERRAERLLQVVPVDAPARTEAEAIQGSTRHLLEIVYGMVDAAKRAHVDCPDAEALESIVQRAIRLLPEVEHGDRIHVNAPPDLPCIRRSDQVARVLANLLDNALAASSQGEQVWVYATRHCDGLRIEVVDHGRGMTTEELENAFDLFYTTREGEGGAGVGLAIAREILHGLDGTLALDSTLGAGTRATITLPLTARH